MYKIHSRYCTLTSQTDMSRMDACTNGTKDYGTTILILVINLVLGHSNSN